MIIWYNIVPLFPDTLKTYIQILIPCSVFCDSLSSISHSHVLYLPFNCLLGLQSQGSDVSFLSTTVSCGLLCSTRFSICNRQSQRIFIFIVVAIVATFMFGTGRYYLCNGCRYDISCVWSVLFTIKMININHIINSRILVSWTAKRGTCTPEIFLSPPKKTLLPS